MTRLPVLRRGLLAAGLGLVACAPPTAPPAAAPSPLPAPFAADTVWERPVAPGVTHSYRWMPEGPWAVHLVEVAPDACGVELRTAKGGDRVIGRATTSALAARAAERLGRPVLAGVNADFFLFDPPGVPVGPQVADGEVVGSSGAPRPVFGVDAAGAPVVGHATVAGVLLTSAGEEIRIGRVNRPPEGEALTLYNRYVGEATPADSGVVEVVVRVGAAGAALGDTVRAVVTMVDLRPEGVEVAAGERVLAGWGAAGDRLRAGAAPGDTLLWVLRAEGLRSPVRELVGGFPVLLRAGRPVFGDDPALRAPFSETRHPRTAAGVRADGTLLLLVVDGRQPGYSAGMSLAELAGLLDALGAREAVNLDGGGSTTLVVAEAVANRPSDRTGERPVANALLVLGPEPGTCPAR